MLRLCPQRQLRWLHRLLLGAARPTRKVCERHVHGVQGAGQAAQAEPKSCGSAYAARPQGRSAGASALFGLKAGRSPWLGLCWGVLWAVFEASGSDSGPRRRAGPAGTHDWNSACCGRASVCWVLGCGVQGAKHLSRTSVGDQRRSVGLDRRPGSAHRAGGAREAGAVSPRVASAGNRGG